MFIRSDTGDTHGVNEPRVIQSVDPQPRVLGIFLTADDNSDSIYEFNEVVGFHVEFFSRMPSPLLTVVPPSSVSNSSSHFPTS